MEKCYECKYYYEEADVNYADCKKEMELKYWEGEECCPEFEGID